MPQRVSVHPIRGSWVRGTERPANVRSSGLRERRHKRAGQARSARRHAGRAWRASSERKDISLHARIEKLDFEHSIGNRLGLPDELVEPLFGGRAVALLVDVSSVSIPRRAPIEEHAETYRRSARWRSHDQMQIARVKTVGDAPVSLVECYSAGAHSPIAAERPLIEPERRWGSIGSALADKRTARRCKALRLLTAEIILLRSQIVPVRGNFRPAWID